jgi:hypothetical protein
MRVQRALANLASFPCQTSNGDLELFAETRAGSFSKGLQHDPLTGIVNATSFQLFVNGIAAHNFDGVPMAGERKFTSPLSGLGFQLSGGDTEVSKICGTFLTRIQLLVFLSRLRHLPRPSLPVRKLQARWWSCTGPLWRATFRLNRTAIRL